MHKRITKIYQAFKLSIYNSLQISYTTICTNKLCICEFHLDYPYFPQLGIRNRVDTDLLFSSQLSSQESSSVECQVQSLHTLYLRHKQNVSFIKPDNKYVSKKNYKQQYREHDLSFIKMFSIRDMHNTYIWKTQIILINPNCSII